MSTIQSLNEADLLLQINRDIPTDIRLRNNELIGKRQSETLTEAEYAELLKLSDQIELMQVQRITALVALAQLRQISLSDLMIALGIAPIA